MGFLGGPRKRDRLLMMMDNISFKSERDMQPWLTRMMPLLAFSDAVDNVIISHTARNNQYAMVGGVLMGPDGGLLLGLCTRHGSGRELLKNREGA